MMIDGAHVILFSKNAKADRAFFRKVLALPKVDAGDGWLIFGLPPSEIAIHPAESSDVHELYLMCADLRAFMREMDKRRIEYASVRKLSWGLLTRIRLPSGATIGVYEPRHPRPESAPGPKAARKSSAPMPGAKKNAAKRARPAAPRPMKKTSARR